MSNRRIITGLLIALVFVAGWLWLSRSDPVERMNPSEFTAYVPAMGDDFDDYVRENRRRIRGALERYYYQESDNPFLAGYSLEQVLEFRSPYEIPPSENCSDRRNPQLGFLLVHGLSDSPYLLKALAEDLSLRYPCALLRGLLTPGHGTVPGDLVSSRLEDWVSNFDYGVDSFAQEVEQLIVVGYSNGSALALDYLLREPDNELVQGLLLLSPGLEPLDSRAFLSPWVKYLARWVNQDADTDAVKYESFPMQAAAEFYRLGKRISDNREANIDLPTLMVVSSDDTTVNNQTAVSFFCNRVSHPQRSLLWYSTPSSTFQPAEECSGVDAIVPNDLPDQFLSFSHVALGIPADDPHYGINGHYPVCIAYAGDPDRLDACRQNNEATVYAENNYRSDALYQGEKLVRRSSFNPDYSNMLNRIVDFVDRTIVQPAPAAR